MTDVLLGVLGVFFVAALAVASVALVIYGKDDG